MLAWSRLNKILSCSHIPANSEVRSVNSTRARKTGERVCRTRRFAASIRDFGYSVVLIQNKPYSQVHRCQSVTGVVVDFANFKSRLGR